ncbi:preQ(1) synthase [Candidatus Palauibacter sp.]|uniref:preQ(1) synthase n=1 Tax=Candidatus Palauibacter sp. TaxID=3101350 RepID=UPI003B021E0B
MTRLPAGGPLPRPRDPEEGREVLRAEAIPAPQVQRVVLRALEFTSLCPKTGQPDFGRVTIDYVPDELLLESKALKFYLWSFRDEGEFCETLAARIADDVVYAVAPICVCVEVEQYVRGGIEIVATAERREPATG